MRIRAFTLIELLVVVATIAVLAAIAVPNFLEAQTRSKLNRALSDMAVMQAALEAYYADHLRYPPNTPVVREWLVASADRELPAADELGAAPAGPTSGDFALEMMMMGGMPQEFQLTRGSEDESWIPALSQEEQARVYEALQHSGSYRGENESDFSILARVDSYAMTSPVSYFSDVAPDDVFASYRSLPFVYYNLADVAEVVGREKVAVPEPRYLLISVGPDTRLSTANPVRGPYSLYDPTNGTVSRGDIISFGRDLTYTKFNSRLK